MSQKMSKSLLKSAKQLLNNAEERFQQALKELEAFTPINFHDKEGNPSPFYLPLIYSLLGHRVEKLQDLDLPLKEARRLLQVGEGLPENVGISCLILQEAALALDFIQGKEPATQNGFRYNGPVAENQFRELGIKLLDGRLAGLALLSGQARNSQVAEKIVQELRSRGLLLLLGGEDLAGQLSRVEWGYESGIIPLGPRLNSLVYAFGFACAFALQFGRVKPGDLSAIKEYNRSNLRSFYLSLGPFSESGGIALAEALALELPVITDVELPEFALPDRLLCVPFDQLPGRDDLEKAENLVERCIDLGGIRVSLPKEPSIPVEYRAELETETISEEALQVELKGFELVTMRDLSEIKDGRTCVVGPEIEKVGREGSIGLLVEVAGHRMKKDFEPVLERQLLHLIGSAKGVEHKGSRDRTQIRFSRKAVQKGLKLEHLGHIVHIGLRRDFEPIVDKVQVTIYTEEEKVRELLKEAREIYRERDARVAGLRDEAVENFYSCLSCQSLSPYHLCIITPERPGMCGAVSWLDCQASYEINPDGQNHPLSRDGCLDPVKGEWESINKYVYEHSQMKFSRFCLNSILDDPPTVSSLCECITTLIPEANGVMVIDREDTSPTPLGMTFGEFLNMAVGTQTPGIIGHAKAYLTSRKFLAAEGGIKRVVWMSKGLKEEMKEGLEEACRRAGEPDLLEKIGDGETTPTIDELLALLQEKNHPALDMPPIM